MGWKWTEAELARYMERLNYGKTKTYTRTSFQAPDVEPTPSHGPLAAKEGKGLDSQFHIRCITRGKRLGDCDGRSIKAALDAFTKAGIWPDDNAQVVKEVSFTQECGEDDETIIELWEIE